MHPPPRTTVKRGDATRSRLALAGIVAVAAVLRLWQLDRFPPGLSVDEAYNLLDALRILDGARPLFLPDNAGREALYSYWQAALVAGLGAGAFPLRLASALIGLLTVGLTMWCAEALPWPRARLTGLVAAALLAGLFWHTLFSRFGIRAISLPLILTLMFGWLWRGLESGRKRHYLLAGVALGVAPYVGTAARILPAVPVLTVGWLVWAEPRRARERLMGLALMLGAAVVVVAPLALYFLEHPAQFTTHLAEVAVVGPGVSGPGGRGIQDGLDALLANVPRVLGMFNVRGDTAWWRNLAGRPVFDPIVGVFFLAGLALLAREAWRPPPQDRKRALAAVACLVWLGVMLTPTLVADGAPNFSRAIGALPVVCILPARALVLAYDRLQGRRPSVAAVMLGGVVAVSLLWTVWDYFGVFAQRPEPYYAYDAEKVRAGEIMRAAAQEGAVYAAPDLAGHATVRATTRGVDVRAYDATRGVVLPNEGAATLFGWAGDAARLPTLEAGAEPRVLGDDLGRPLLAASRIEAPTTVEHVRGRFGLRTVEHRFGEVIALRGYAAAPGTGGAGPTLTLLWEALAPMERDLVVFVHFQTDTGQTMTQADGEPLGATYPTTRWAQGERIVERRTAPPLPPGVYHVRIGWYERGDGARLPVAGGRENAVDLGTVEVRP